MNFIVTALMVEAKPIIEYFKLKKDMSFDKFPIYRNHNTALVISGIGKVKSAMATIYLLTSHISCEKDILINIGFCGTNNTNYKIGDLILINKITDIDTKKDFYPDIYIDRKLPKKPIMCYSLPVDRQIFTSKEEIFCDMESAGFIQAASKFFYSHQIVILKIISDYLNPENINKEMLKHLGRNHMPSLREIIENVGRITSKYKNVLLYEEESVFKQLSENLNLTWSMKQILSKKIKKSLLEDKKPLEILKSFKNITANSKSERKKIFEQIINRL